MKKIILFTFLILGLSSCKTIDDLEVIGTPYGQFKGFDNGTFLFDLQVKINNPNAQSFKVKSGNFKVFINGNHVGNSSFSDVVKIESKSTETYHFPLQAKLDGKDLSLGFLLGGLLQRGMKIKVEGEIKAGTFLITRSFPVSWEDDL